MKSRCAYVEHYPHHAGLGIEVCDAWSDSFEIFAKWAVENGWVENQKLTSDRFPDPFGNYEPNNCRWVTQKLNSRNMRYRYLINVAGIMKGIPELKEEYACTLPYSTIRNRLERGWSWQTALGVINE